MSWEISPQQVFSASPIVPVMVIKNVEDAIPMAQAYWTAVSVFLKLR